MSDLLKRAADASACQMLNDIGSAGTQLAVWTMWTPKVALVPLTIGGLSYMANNLLCQDMAGPPESIIPDLDGCQKGQPGWEGNIYFRREDGYTGVAYGKVNEMVAPTYIREFNGKWGMRWECRDKEGKQVFVNTPVADTGEEAVGAKYWLDGPGLECQKENDPNSPGQPNPDLPDYDYTDPETNCNYTLKLEGFVQQYEDGPAQPVWNIRSADADSARSDGGRMGGCNLSPTIYIDGPGGPGSPGGPNPIPVPPNPPGPDGDGVPWWLKSLLGAATGALLNQIGRVLNDTFNYPMEPGLFELVAPCNYDDEGSNESRRWAFPETSLIVRLHDHQVAMMEIMQQHLDWKTPTCSGNAKPPLEGQWVTTRWESIEKMAHSGRRLRKLFRYRTKSTRDLGQLSAYWADFSWRSGDVCVIHKGAWWGTPQVWAESEDEGKRVIRHASAEAGLDPDQVGGWAVSSSRSPRYGMSGTMKAAIFEGFPWIASRDGAAWPNILAK